MSGFFFNTRDDFHYDHSGYYGYIVFNGDKQTLDGLLQALGQGVQSRGLGWYRYGKSFRPANDGKMYDWYVRLHSGGTDKPIAQAVDDFLQQHLEPPRPAPQPAAPPDLPAGRLSKDLNQLQTDIARETAVHQAALSAQQRLATLLGKLQGIDMRISDDLEQLRRDLQDVALTWRADDWSNLNLGSVIHALDAVNVRLTRDLTLLQQDYSDIASVHADSLRAQDELAKVLKSLKDHDAHISEDLTRLQQDVQHIVARDGQREADGGQAAMLTRFDALEQHVGERIDGLAVAIQAGTAAQAELEEKQQELADMQQTMSDAEEKITRLEQNLASRSPDASEGLRNEIKGLEKAKTARDDRIKDLRKQLREQNKVVTSERDYWKQQHEDAVAELEKQQETEAASNGKETAPQRSNGRVTGSELEDILRGAFPGLVLAQDSLGTLYHGIQNYRPVMALLHRIVNVREFNGRNPVRDGKQNTKWREDVVSEEWRIYFCKESRLLGDKCVVYLGDKNHQKDDIKWLRANPPETCL